jgi:hypothetical protein
MSDVQVEIAFRIPGKWSGPQELIERLPEGHRFTAQALILPDGTEIGFSAMDADDQFAEIFKSSCRRPPTFEEWAAVRKYSANVILCGPGGSPDAARTMMQAAAAIIRAGGAGVFIDNSTVAHGGRTWLELTDDGGPDALTFGYVAIIGGDHEVRKMGMHVLGRRDVVMKKADADADEFGIIDVMRYLCESEKPIEDGHLLADLDGPRFRAVAEDDAEGRAGSPMHNPFGRLKLVSMKDAAEQN